MDSRFRRLKTSDSSPVLSRSLPTSRSFPSGTKSNCFQQCLNTSTDSLNSDTNRSPKLGQYRKIPNRSECEVCHSLVKDTITLKCFHSTCTKCLEKYKIVNNGCPVCIADSSDSQSNSSCERTPDSEFLHVTADDILFDDSNFEKHNISVEDLFDNLQNNVLTSLLSKYSFVKEEHTQVVKDAEEEIRKIRNHVEHLKQLIDKKAEMLMKNVLESKARHCAELERQESNLREFIDHVKDSIKEFQKVLHNQANDNGSLVKTEDSIRQLLKLSNQVGKESVHIRFNVKQTTDAMIDGIVGRVGVRVFLENPLQTTLQTTLVFPASVHCICPINNHQAWIGYQNFVQLVSKSGARFPAVDLTEDVHDLCLDESENVLIACQNSVKILNKQLNVFTLFTLTEPPMGIACQENGSLVICMHNKVSVFSRDGVQQSEVQAHECGDIRIPYKVAINCNGDICVTDFQSTLGEVTIFDTTYRPVAKIKTEGMAPRGIACNRQGLIYACDFRADRINLYSTHGHFLQTVVSASCGLSGPLSVAVDQTGDLWVGDWKRKVRVFNQSAEVANLDVHSD